MRDAGAILVEKKAFADSSFRSAKAFSILIHAWNSSETSGCALHSRCMSTHVRCHQSADDFLARGFCLEDVFVDLVLSALGLGGAM